MKILWLYVVVSLLHLVTSSTYEEQHHLRVATEPEVHPQHRHLQQFDYRHLINEVLFLPDPLAKHPNARRAFVEIRHPIGWGIKDCTLENDDGSFRVEFDFTDGLDYLTVMHEPNLDTEQELGDVMDGKQSTKIRTLWVKEMPLKEIDAVGLSCQGEMIDFVAWGNGTAPNGPLVSMAVTAGMWSNKNEFVESVQVNVAGLLIGLRKGDSIGRDKEWLTNDTNSPKDWHLHGGLNADGPTPSERNLGGCIQSIPKLNEVLIKPMPTSKTYRKRRRFVELYRDERYGCDLGGCSLVNNAQSFRVDISPSFNTVRKKYVSVRERTTLAQDVKLEKRKGLIWVKSMDIKEVDGVALVCRGAIVDYVGESKPSSCFFFQVLFRRMLIILQSKLSRSPG